MRRALPILLLCGLIDASPAAAQVTPTGRLILDHRVGPAGRLAGQMLPPGPPAWQAALASLIVPGAGQVWQGRGWGWLLTGLEGGLIGSGLWAGREGRRRRDAYQEFADAHWDRQRWTDYLAAYQAVNGMPWPYDHHTLPAPGVRNHDYYEMIGKYEQFAPGWADWVPDTSLAYRGDSPLRDDYLHRRLVTNRYLKWALTSGGLIFLNHVAAAAEVLLWSHLPAAGRPSLRVRPAGDAASPALMLQCTWRPFR